MIRDLLSFFNLTQMPFTKEILSSALLTLPSVEKAIESLKMLIEIKGIGMVFGKSGAGKSSLIRILLEGLNQGLYYPVYLCHTSISLTEFYSHLSTVLGLEPTGRRAAMFRNIQNRILTLNKTNRTHPILIIDEAHMLRNEILAEIRLLLNFEIDSFKGLTVILCGQEFLKAKLGLSILEPLANSITISVFTDGLPEDETYSYIEKRLHDSGNGNPIFTKNALKMIYQASGGIFRVIGKVAEASLIKAFQMKSNQVEAEHVKMCLAR